MRSEVADGQGEQSRRLAHAIRDVKNATADREDVVVELREATRMRLELLANELQPVIAELPSDVDMFDFAVSSGLQPRLWIDAIAHVSMGRDRRTYRFLKDTRIGRVVLAESADMKPVVEQVTRYVAERIVERQRLMDGAVEPGFPGIVKRGIDEAAAPLRLASLGGGAMAVAAVALIIAGALFGLGAAVALIWAAW